MTLGADEARRGGMIPHAWNARSVVHNITKLTAGEQATLFTFMTDGVVFINIVVSSSAGRPELKVQEFSLRCTN